MGRRKKPENETPEQAKDRGVLESIANHANRSEKTSWKHKLGKMEALLAKLEPIEMKILTIIADEKQPLMDQVANLRAIMVKDCVHPYGYLVKKEDHIECKFCNAKLKVPRGS